MTHLASRASLRVTLALALLVLVLTAAFARPAGAAAQRDHAVDKGAHSTKKRAKKRSRAAACAPSGSRTG